MLSPECVVARGAGQSISRPRLMGMQPMPDQAVKLLP
jgi:hypothetical protein